MFFVLFCFVLLIFKALHLCLKKIFEGKLPFWRPSYHKTWTFVNVYFPVYSLELTIICFLNIHHWPSECHGKRWWDSMLSIMTCFYLSPHVVMCLTWYSCVINLAHWERKTGETKIQGQTERKTLSFQKKKILKPRTFFFQILGIQKKTSKLASKQEIISNVL